MLVLQVAFSLVFGVLLSGTSINSDLGLIRLKPTIGQVTFALLLSLSVAVSRNGVVYLAWGNRLGLGGTFWRSFTNLSAVMFLLLGITNLISIYFLNIEQWLLFKATFPLLIEMIFCLTVPAALLNKQKIVSSTPTP